MAKQPVYTDKEFLEGYVLATCVDDVEKNLPKMNKTQIQTRASRLRSEGVYVPRFGNKKPATPKDELNTFSEKLKIGTAEDRKKFFAGTKKGKK